MISQDIYNFMKILKILEIDPERLNLIDKPTKFAQIILPDESFFNDENTEQRYFTNEYRETIEMLRNFSQKNFTPISNKKIYFSISRDQIGEERLAEYLKGNGYDIINPATLSVEEELNILTNCENFATTIGSASHNVIFLKNGVHMLVIPRANYLTPLQMALDKVHELNIEYIDSTISIYQPFCYIISGQLKKIFGDEWDSEYTEEDFITFLNYVKIARANGFKESEEAKKYYSTVLPDFIEQLKKREDLIEKFGVTIDIN